ncbi:hypothetical protein BVG16_06155 [Paenibacillus selenitireducens]|uniref:Uncharacterized protein n=1 Tax=Paenibacillus selenitireducens TaxID=1324314 RepID=A0A1T2XKD1_9BACL|nr:hypothetical protein [Paenibacillus selenitireducens]OPA80314.1 hypothetical protein BVG16_06155 [Paenibacillus selenitireducens]
MKKVWRYIPINKKSIVIVISSLILITLVVLNFYQLSLTIQHNRMISNIDTSLISELDGLAQRIKEDTIPDSIVISQASKIAALSDYSSYNFHYAYTLETRLLELHYNNLSLHNVIEIKNTIKLLMEDFTNTQLINKLDSLLISK